MKAGAVYIEDTLVGQIREEITGYSFTYDANYLKSDNAEPISLTLPLTTEPYYSKVMIPFFDGLIPEGWLLDIAERNWKINQRDRMSLLLACCKDCIGRAKQTDNSWSIRQIHTQASNGFKRNLLRTDFEQVMESTGLSTKVIGRIIEKLISSETLWKQTISNSFLPSTMQESLTQIISQRIARLKL